MNGDFEPFSGSFVEQKEISKYLYNHFLIDDFGWLLKLQYSDKDTIKTKKCWNMITQIIGG